MAKSKARDTNPASGPLRKQPGSARRLHMQGVATIESVLGSGSQPVLGLYLHTIHNHLLKGLSRDRRFNKILPHLIGTPALLSKYPGMSQIELAALLGCERATAGLQVTQCIEKGWVRRVESSHDGRRYELYITKKGQRMLEVARSVIPAHEEFFAGSLSTAERKTLRELLSKLIVPD
jgi:DNA-binding MarR family transcriptional regulator